VEITHEIVEQANKQGRRLRRQQCGQNTAKKKKKNKEKSRKGGNVTWTTRRLPAAH